MRFAKTNPIKIVLLGAGGTGGHLAPHLYRLAYSLDRSIRIVIADGDIVESKNLVRQNFIIADLGENKAKVLAERYSSVFGMETEYIPGYIENEQGLLELVTPESYNGYYSPILEERVILIGAVDNNRSRQLCHNVFLKTKNLVYIDSGNGEYTGQVVCGMRRNGKTIYKPVCGIYPEMLLDEDVFPTDLTCAQRNESAPQSIAANVMAATAVISFLYNLLVLGNLDVRMLTFSSRTISIKPTINKKGRKAK